MRLERLQLREPLPRRVQLELNADQLRALGVEVGLDLGDLGLQAADARVELAQPTGRRVDLALKVGHLALACADLLLKLALAGRVRGRRVDRDRDRGEKRETRRDCHARHSGGWPWGSEHRHSTGAAGIAQPP